MAQDPTRTVTIRRQWIRDFNKRYALLKRDIRRFLLNSETTVVNVAFEFGTNPDRLAEFLAFLQGRIDARLFDNALQAGNMWQNVYITRGYERGVRIAIAEMRRQGINVQTALFGATPASVVGTASPALGGLGLSGAVIHSDAVQLLYVREFEALKGITNEMSKQISRVLVQGIEQGLGINELTRNILNRVDKIGRTRSRLLARTETVRAYNIANINETKFVAGQIGEDVGLEWVTAGDERVRNTHATRNGVIFTEERARVLIGEPNCRCSLVPHFEDLDTDADREERTTRRQQGLAQVGIIG